MSTAFRISLTQFVFVKIGKMHFALISPSGIRESVGGHSQSHYPTKTLSRREGRLREYNLHFRFNSLLSQNYQFWNWDSGNSIRGRSRYFPFFTLRETISICYHRSCLFRKERERERNVRDRESRWSRVFFSRRIPPLLKLNSHSQELNPRLSTRWLLARFFPPFQT